MTPRATHHDALDEKLDIYRREAAIYKRREGQADGRTTSAQRIAGYGALASIAPLVASFGTAAGQDVQCLSVRPTGPIVLSVGTTYTDALTVYAGTLPILQVFVASGPIPFFGMSGANMHPIIGYPYVGTAPPPISSMPVVVRASASQTITPPSVTGFGVLCALTSASSFAGFCQGSGSGFVVLDAGGSPGFLELNVTSFAPTKAEFQLGAFLQISPGPDGHPGDCGSILPVELVTFTGLSDHGVPVLAWETASELNNAGFEIQRAGADGQFDKVDFVEGRGTTTDPQTYTYSDESARPNTHYRYRLKQIDLDGTTSFSQIVEVFTEVPDELLVSNVYPNPVVSGRARIDLNTADASEVTIEIFDTRGALVSSRTQVANRGENRISLDTENLVAGSHFAKIQFGNQVEYRSFVVIR